MDSDPPTRPSTMPNGMLDAVVGNPYLHFILSEMWATLTGIAVYAFFRFGAYVTQTIAPLLPLNDPAPALFLETLLNWGSAIGAGATFVIISLYQIIVLIKRLWERFRQ